MTDASLLSVTLVPSADNYIYLVTWDGGAAVVDPGTVAPILKEIEDRGLDVQVILATHHHGDHIGGIPEVRQATGATVIVPAGAGIGLADREVVDGETFPLGPVTMNVIATPGHTRTDLTYYSEEAGVAFVGDTLFAGGCGRLFECGPETMWASLSRLKALPGETEVYCGHEYTESNLAFAVTVDPENEALAERVQSVSQLRRAGRPTIPTTIALERETNPFLRPDQPGIRAALAMEDASDADVFAELRARKDRF